MRRFQLTLACCLFVVTGFSQTNQHYSAKDTDALNDLVVKWGKYWNTHDMVSMGALLTDDVDFVNVAGRWLKGKKVTVAHHKERHDGVVFNKSIWTTDSVAIKYVKSDLAIMHIKWGIKGDFDPDGTPRIPREGIFTWVVTNRNTEWLILAAHNVNVRETPVK